MSLDAWSWPCRLSRPRCPLPRLHLSPLPLRRGEQRGAGWQHGHHLLQWRPRGHSPFHHKEGVLHGHGVPAPSCLTPAPRTGRPRPPSLPLPTTPACRSRRRFGLGNPEQLARAGWGARDRRWSSNRSPRRPNPGLRRRPPGLPPPPAPPGASGRLDPAPGTCGSVQPQTRPAAPLPHPRSRDQDRPRLPSAELGRRV